MIVHFYLDPLILEDRPWIGVVIGLAGVLMMSAVAVVFLNEYVSLERQASPAVISADAALPGCDSSRKWVTMTGGVWHCDRVVEVPRDAPEKWLFGPIDCTQIPVTDATATRLIVVEYAGQVSCEDLADRSVTGILSCEGDRVWGSHVSREIGSMAHRPPALVLHADMSPDNARTYVLLSSGFVLAFAAFAGYYVNKWRRKGRLRRVVS